MVLVVLALILSSSGSINVNAQIRPVRFRGVKVVEPHITRVERVKIGTAALLTTSQLQPKIKVYPVVIPDSSNIRRRLTPTTISTSPRLSPAISTCLSQKKATLQPAFDHNRTQTYNRKQTGFSSTAQNLLVDKAVISCTEPQVCVSDTNKSDGYQHPMW